jgi:hypothetical protein
MTIPPAAAHIPAAQNTGQIYSDLPGFQMQEDNPAPDPAQSHPAKIPDKTSGWYLPGNKLRGQTAAEERQ